MVSDVSLDLDHLVQFVSEQKEEIRPQKARWIDGNVNGTYAPLTLRGNTRVEQFFFGTSSRGPFWNSWN